jgi:amidohydrolase
MKNLKKRIKLLASSSLKEITNVRRHLHQNPELSRLEVKTCEYIIAKLKEYGISNIKIMAKTGVVAIIEGKNPGSKTIGLRADMDALPVHEATEVPYKSIVDGVMHACGHDVHIASLLGTAKILNELKDDFEGSVKLIFQPSEEKYPGGAIMMIKEGVLENPLPVAMFGQHVLPTLEVGKVGMKPGKYMASTDEIYLTINGKGGHGATPELNVDPILIASHIIVALQQIVSRNAVPTVPSVLSFGRIIGNGRTNIIPDNVIVEGTFRTYDEKWRAEAHIKITKMAQMIAESMGGSCDVFIDKGYPYLVNDDETTEKVEKYAIDFLGKENIVDLDMRLTAEDFAYFSQKVPSCFYRLGCMNEKKGITANLHSPNFNVDENCLETGMGLMAWVTVNELV